MPVVPFIQPAKGANGKPLPTPPAEPFALMAAAQMHAEGRLVKGEPTGKSPLNE